MGGWPPAPACCAMLRYSSCAYSWFFSCVFCASSASCSGVSGAICASTCPLGSISGCSMGAGAACPFVAGLLLGLQCNTLTQSSLCQYHLSENVNAKEKRRKGAGSEHTDAACGQSRKLWLVVLPELNDRL